MSLENVLRWILCSIEVVDVDKVDEHAGKQMSTVRENYFTTSLDSNVFVLRDSVREHIHHPDAIEKADYDLETSWVEGDTHGLIWELLGDLQFKAEGWTIAPYLDSSIGGACCNKILLDADIHA